MPGKKGDNMPGKMALVDYKKCQPDKCDSGICAVAIAALKDRTDDIIARIENLKKQQQPL
jgi:translation initiation factor RLI1